MEITNNEKTEIEITNNKPNDKKAIDRSKYKGRYTEYNKEYHKQRYLENKEQYKANVVNRRKQIKKALELLKTQGINLNEL